jgi:hypothetical protein
MASGAIRVLVVAAALIAPAGAQAATGVSSNWAGYVVTPKAAGTKFKTVSGTWTVPQGDCSAGNGYSATWVGIGGYRDSSSALEQTGTEFDCHNGTAKYSAWFELVPDVSHDIAMTVRPGDVIDAAVTLNKTRVTIYLRNRTRGAVFRRTIAMARPDSSSAEWIVEAPANCNGSGQCVQLPISNFGAIAFSHASTTTARGTRGGITSPGWSQTQLTLSQANRFARFASARGAAPSPLSPDGAGFTVAYTEQAGDYGRSSPVSIGA